MSEWLEQAQPDASDVRVHFLAQDEQRAETVVQWLAAFMRGARRTLDVAVYDFRLSDPLKAIVADALAECAARGVAIRIAYDADKPEQPLAYGMDPAPQGTGSFVQSLGYPFRRIGGIKLMHHKYLVRDAGTSDGAVWTGSTNLSDASWTLQENNIVEIASPELAAYYGRDFEEIWDDGNYESSGAFDTLWVEMRYQGQPLKAMALFAPGRGDAIDREVAEVVRQANERVRICSMLLNSSALLNSLQDVLRAGVVPVSGIYDQTQMEDVLRQWQDVPHNHWKIGAIREIVVDAGLVGKHSTPYRPDGRHDFMHDKVLVVDDIVITGSYNFSHSAEQNAENILLLQSRALADAYSAYIDHLTAKYSHRQND
jgi:phosphatidylserine/phosphatidylglycerophosphate/cardiolipin synthase-like enzyme